MFDASYVLSLLRLDATNSRVHEVQSLVPIGVLPAQLSQVGTAASIAEANIVWA